MQPATPGPNLPTLHARRVLFMGEGLAHVGRLIALATAARASGLEVAVATSEAERVWVDRAGLPWARLTSLDPARLLERLAKGAPTFDAELLQQQVEEDERLIAAARPDFVVGDFRLSLSISAKRARTPFICLVNGVWSPNTSLRFVVPDVLPTRLFGRHVGVALGRLALPFVLRRQVAEYNRARQRFGLSSLRSLNEVYTLADLTLYPDLPRLAPTEGLPQGHHYLGPVRWEPPAPLPPWWKAVDDTKPLVYLSVGSSGSTRILDLVLHALEALPVTLVATTANRDLAARKPQNALLAPFLPGHLLARRASLVITNGGSGGAYQALGEGKPVLALPSNADQYLCASALVGTGAGVTLRAGNATVREVRRAVQTLLEKPSHRASARQLATEIAAFDGVRRFAGLLTQSPHRITSHA